jgi:hypothetical protein
MHLLQPQRLAGCTLRLKQNTQLCTWHCKVSRRKLWGSRLDSTRGGQAVASVSAAARQLACAGLEGLEGLHRPLQLSCSTGHTQPCAIAALEAAQPAHDAWPVPHMHALSCRHECRLAHSFWQLQADSTQLLRLHPPCRRLAAATAAGHVSYMSCAAHGNEANHAARVALLICASPTCR